MQSAYKEEDNSLPSGCTSAERMREQSTELNRGEYQAFAKQLGNNSDCWYVDLDMQGSDTVVYLDGLQWAICAIAIMRRVFFPI